MTALIPIFFAALMITIAGTPVVRRVALRLGFVDAPAKRKLHQEPMPLMGGVAIFIGAIAAFLILFTFFDITNRVIGIWLALLIVAVIGLVDDRRGMSARVKLGGLGLAVLVLLYFDVSVSLRVPMWLNYLITVVWILGISNATNFLDNMDGLAAGTSGVSAAFVTVLAVYNDQYLVSALGAAVFGACLGFLRYNFKPAKIFMGDAGSLFLGFVLAILGLLLRFPDNTNVVTWLVPIFVLGLPIYDTTLVIVSRSRRGVNPFTTAGKDHTSHRLTQLGFTQREAVLILYLTSGMFGMVALFVAQATVQDAIIITAVMASLGLYTIWWLERWRDQHPSPPSATPPR
ncbi:MAG: undecaprenyl/decaprenyl-phosphate alpha-N-acetylglucosaminyl 1-phosphate transferase [Anaerolineales bacterium]|nr:undecaprenyl/decaprenyl-phosphate alpha-N-acetylglucosaminyl 1-phosphate transferase [Anaerolineales bacterium]